VGFQSRVVLAGLTIAGIQILNEFKLALLFGSGKIGIAQKPHHLLGRFRPDIHRSSLVFPRQITIADVPRRGGSLPQ